jgi:hypothetical protein
MVASMAAPTPSPLSGPADGLAAASALRAMADRIEDAEVERAMRAGWSWSQVAEALGVTRQAVHKKHLRRLLMAQIELRRRSGE